MSSNCFFPDVRSSVGSGAGTIPSGRISKVVKTTPFSSARADSGIPRSKKEKAGEEDFFDPTRLQ